MSTPAEHFSREFETLAPALPGFELARRAAMARFSEVGLPTAREEAWKYTRVTPLEKRNFSVETGETPTLKPDDLSQLGFVLPGTDVLAFVNGRYEPTLSKLTDGTGISVTPLGAALAKNENAVAPYLSEPAANVTAFTALNTAFVRDGVIVNADAGARRERALHLRFIAAPGDAPLAAHPRLIIDLGEGAQLDVIESYTGTGSGAHFNNVFADLRLGRGASLRHCKLHEEGDAGVHIATTRVQQAADSQYHSLSVALDGQLVRNDIDCELNGTGASCTLHGVFMGSGRSHIDYHTRVDHKAPGAVSDELYKSVLGGRARGVFNGRVYVHPNAQQTEAHQKNDNLLLSRHAEIDTKPQLEIYADDVKCSHGATVGQLDENALFYLRARGIEEQAARGLLIYGFASDVLRQLPMDGLAGALEPRMLAHMPEAQSIAEVLT